MRATGADPSALRRRTGERETTTEMGSGWGVGGQDASGPVCKRLQDYLHHLRALIQRKSLSCHKFGANRRGQENDAISAAPSPLRGSPGREKDPNFFQEPKQNPAERVEGASARARLDLGGALTTAGETERSRAGRREGVAGWMPRPCGEAGGGGGHRGLRLRRRSVCCRSQLDPSGVCRRPAARSSPWRRSTVGP